MRKIGLFSFLLAFAFLSTAGSAWPQVIGNPVPNVEPGRLGVGLGLEQFNRDVQVDVGGSDDLDYSRTTFQLNYGVSKGAMAQGFLTFARAKPDGGDAFSGIEFGAGYRQTIDVTIPAGDSGIETALFGNVRYGSLDDGESFDYFQFDLGYGGSYPISKRLNAFGGLLYSEIWGEIGSRSVSADDNFGLFGGAEFGATESLHLSGELHLLHEFGLALLVQFNF